MSDKLEFTEKEPGGAFRLMALLIPVDGIKRAGLFLPEEESSACVKRRGEVSMGGKLGPVI